MATPAAEARENERITAAIATHLAGVTSEVATQLATLTAASNTEIKVAIEGLKGEVHEINSRLGDYVPRACIEHNQDMKIATKRIGDLEEANSQLWKEKASGVLVKVLIGLWASTLGAAITVIIALAQHYKP